MGKYWNDSEFIKVVKHSTSISEILRYFNIPTQQGYYHKIFHNEVMRLKLDITHLKPFRKSSFKMKSIDEIFAENSTADRSTIRQKILKLKLLEYKCAICCLTEWQNKPLSLHLDHTNGIPTDHRLENLRFLCPNCHSQTITYAGKNIKVNHLKKICKGCNKSKKTTRSVFCKACCHKFSVHHTKIVWPNPNEVKNLVDKHNFSIAGRLLGVSDAAIRKFLKKNNLL